MTKIEQLAATTKRLDFCIERMLQVPEVSRIFLQSMVDKHETVLNCSVDELNDAEVYATVQEILEKTK